MVEEPERIAGLSRDTMFPLSRSTLHILGVCRQLNDRACSMHETELGHILRSASAFESHWASKVQHISR